MSKVRELGEMIKETNSKFDTPVMQQPTNGADKVKPLFTELENYVFKA